MTRTVLLIKNTIILTATSIIIGVASIYFNAYLAKHIGAEQMGVWTLIMSVYLFAITLATSGINLAAVRLVAEEASMGKGGNVASAMRSCLAYATCFGLLAAAALTVFAPFIGEHFLRNPSTVLPLRVLAISLPFMAVSTVLSGYFTAMQQGIRTSSAQILEQFARFFICARLLTMFVSNAYLAIVLAATISEILGCIYRFLLWKRPRKTKGEKLTKRMLGIALPVAFSSYLKQALTTTKQILVPISLQMGGLSTATALSHYGIIQGMAIPLLLFPACLLNSFTTMLVPEIARLHIQGHKKRIRGAIFKIFIVTLIYGVLVSIVFSIFAQQFANNLYKNQDAAFYIKILAFSVPIMYFDYVVDGLLKGLDKQVAVVKINIIDSLIVIAMFLTILPRWGISGYIFVFFASEALNALLSLFVLWRTVISLNRM